MAKPLLTRRSRILRGIASVLRGSQPHQQLVDLRVEFREQAGAHHLQHPLVVHVQEDGSVLQPAVIEDTDASEFQRAFAQRRVEAVHPQLPVVEFRGTHLRVKFPRLRGRRDPHRVHESLEEQRQRPLAEARDFHARVGLLERVDLVSEIRDDALRCTGTLDGDIEDGRDVLEEAPGGGEGQCRLDTGEAHEHRGTVAFLQRPGFAPEPEGRKVAAIQQLLQACHE
ncbi:MAG: hypothetical protein IPM40_21610, partial [Gammaproteobacteria bacterium]|nr:hypothetical protein [Gammaproteobacteria bacterium]